MKTSALIPLLILAASCISTPPASELKATSPTPMAGHSRDHSPAPAVEEEGPSPATSNRDRHGPRDTGQYIAMLSSPDRVKQLKTELVAQKIKTRLDLSPKAVIADIGCGPGVFVWPFAAIVPRGFVFAVDVEPAQLDTLRSGLLERGIENVVPVLASYESPHLPSGLVDVAFIADTYHHFEDRVAYFSNLRRSLTANGALVLLEFKDGEIPIGPPSGHKIPLAKRHAELKAAGFELVESLGTHIWQDLEIWQRARVTR